MTRRRTIRFLDPLPKRDKRHAGDRLRQYRAQRAKAQKRKKPTCRWSADELGIYQTDCGWSFTFIDDGPVENKMGYCCYCGRILHAAAVACSSATARRALIRRLRSRCQAAQKNRGKR